MKKPYLNLMIILLSLLTLLPEFDGRKKQQIIRK